MLSQSKLIKLLYALLVCIALSSCGVQNESKKNPYTYKANDPNGIGKWYMGREIASVMGFEGMEWLERPEREAEENVNTLLLNMNIQPNDTLADIGAGSGYHVFKMATMAHTGLIYAVDIQSEMLGEIQSKKEAKHINNVELILGTETSVNLPENSVDKILLVDVYHEFSHPYEMMKSIKKALRPNGKIFLIEYRSEDFRVPIKEVHKMTQKQAVKELKAVGLKLDQNLDNLPWQHCMIFIKP
ncbi:MAG: class I SAM-dependent methyltransferase [Flavobacteriaceae bacterium]|nr:class I SAM-dependent methyltransferase [Flavobacteriaceae bacterium]